MSTKFSILISLFLVFMFVLSITLIAIGDPGGWETWRVTLTTFGVSLWISPIAFIMAKTYPKGK